MRIILILFFLTGIFFQIQAQTNSDSARVVFFVSTLPEFPGGDTAFMSFIIKNLVYPEDAKMQGITGKVYIQFVVNVDGSLSDFQVVKGRGLSPSCDQAVIDMIKKSPRWKPATLNGVPKAIKLTRSFKFE